MVFYGFHGVHDEERRLGQRFIVSAALYTDKDKDSQIRTLDDTVDYTKVYDDIKSVMESQQFHLLESCANTIADKILANYHLVQKVEICIQKPSVPIPGSLENAEIQIARKRK